MAQERECGVLVRIIYTQREAFFIFPIQKIFNVCNARLLILYYDLFRHRKDENGNLDPVMSYGSCPVLHGMKLGINKNVIVAKGRNQILQHRVTK